jgi:hypothetical protein
MPRNTDILPAGTVKVLLLKSWGETSVWQDMSTNWQNFGKRAVTVDTTTYIGSDFTYQDIVSSKANVKTPVISTGAFPSACGRECGVERPAVAR